MARIGDRVGNIRLVGELGAGGMGQVYVGFDETLQRRVALKEIRRHRRLQPAAQARFLREARILSQLEHPNICRIYDYLVDGESEFLVLELIQGSTLSRAVEKGLTDQQKLRIALEVATVLAAAHGEGIIHRDLKPDNVMITPTGGVTVLDFGLARVVETGPVGGDSALQEMTTGDLSPMGDEEATLLLPEDPSPDETLTLVGDPASGQCEARHYSPRPAEHHTLEGAVLGSLLYMSPEQARGEVATTASDLYSFGLLLQFLYTGRSPYDKELRGTDLIRSAAHGETLSPTGVEAGIGALIERLKAMAPAARPTALAIVERLEWIRDKPKRRLRRLAAAGITIAVLLATIKYTIDLRRERSAAVAAREVAEQRRVQAEDLIGFMLGDLRSRLEPVGRLEILDEVGAKAMAYFAAVDSAELSDIELLRRSQALYQIGDVRQAQGDLTAASEAFEQSMALARDLVERDPANTDWLANLGNSHFWVGSVYWLRGDLERAREELEAYRQITRQLVAADPTNINWQMERFYGEANVGRVQEAAGDVAAAHDRFAEGLEILEVVAAMEEPGSDLLLELATAHLMLASAKKSLGDLEGAAVHYEKDLEIVQQLVDQSPEHSGWRDRLATSQSWVGLSYLWRGDLPEAREHFRTHLDLAERLAAQDPENTLWQDSLATAHLNLGQTYTPLGDPEAALRHLRAARRILENLTAAEPDKARWQLQLVKVRTELGRAQASRGDSLGAVESVEAALESLTEITSASTNPEAKLQLIEALLLHGRILAAAGRDEAATAEWSLALATVEPLARDSRDGKLIGPWALALLRLGRRDEAEPLLALLREQRYVYHEIERDLAAGAPGRE